MPRKEGGQPGNKNATGGKLNQDFIDAFKSVIKSDPNNNKFPVIIHTDEDLVHLTNERLPKEKRIHFNTFKNWKNENITNELLESFLALYRTALIKQRENLFDSLLDEEKDSKRYTWIIERKFKEWNLKTISENTNNNNNTNMNVDVKLSEQEKKDFKDHFENEY